MKQISSIFVCLLIVSLLLTSINGETTKSDEMLTKLDCQEGETRSFRYSSETNLWGPMEEQIAVNAIVDIDCMGRDNNTGALKYMVQISNVKTDLKRDGKLINLQHRSEMGKIVRRREKRSEVSDWVAESWQKIKSFFTRFLRKQLNKQLEDKIELDLEGRGCTLPTNPKGSTADREKRSTSNSVNHLLDEKIELPFEFVQLPGGPIPEIRLSKLETNEAVKNFKKHIVDTFATQLATGKQSTIEKSPIGEHISHYEYHEVAPDQPIEETLSVAGYPSFMINRKGKAFVDDDKQESPTVNKKMQVIREVSRSDVIKVGSGSVLIHDPDQNDRDGFTIFIILLRLLLAGLISVDLTKPMDQSAKRRKRSLGLDDDLDGFMKVLTAYSMNSSPNQRAKRETGERLAKLRKVETDLDLVSESLVSSSSPETENQDRLVRLQGLITEIALSQQTFDFSKNSEQRNPDFDLLIAALQIEAKLKLTQTDGSSLSSMVRQTITRQKLDANCGAGTQFNLTKCHDLLVIATIAGSPVTLQVITESFASDPVGTSSVLSRVDHPSEELVANLVKQFTKTSAYGSPKGSMLMTLSSLAHKSDSNVIKKSVSKLLMKELEATASAKCDSLYTLDVLEAIGNLGGEKFVPVLINLSNTQCTCSDSMKIGIIHALRQMVDKPEVIEFLTTLLMNSTIDCSIRKEIVATLFSSKLITISGSQTLHQSQYKFTNPIETNPVVTMLSESILNSTDSADDCIKEELEKALKMNNNEYQSARRKRSVDNGFWDDSSCTDHSSTPAKAPSTPEFPMVSDGKKDKKRLVETPSVGYVQRRKCTAIKSFGPKQVQAILRADIINDVLDSSENPDYKLTANFGLSSHVLGKNVDVGKMYLYAKRNISRAYVSLFGQTLLDSQRDSCDTRPLEPYRYTAYVPLYDFNIWVVRLGLGLRFNGELAFDHLKSNCLSNTEKKKRSEASSESEIDELLIKPGAQLRVAGEASGTILLLRGGVDIGGDFNYQSDLQFKPKPGFCLTAYNAHRPMNVSVQPWFQFWDSSCQEWSNRHIYRPEMLNWKVTESRSSPWIQNECIIRK
uniref:Vitellogenin domain-containing protein n=1 Tax=Tetranychus urticae TaxID=32264 RepID=T1K6S6_TETUR